VSAPGEGRAAGVERSPFGRLATGEAVDVFTLRNSGGVRVRVSGYGGVIVSIHTPDREGRLADVVLGYDDLGGYVGDDAYLGALVGRYANRIRGGRFVLDGRQHTLATNDGPNHLHGGERGFNKFPWAAEPFHAADGVGVALARTSPDGEEGYPGALDVRVRYTLSDQDELALEYRATAGRATPVNLTQHSYFNLAGDPARDVLGHEIRIEADRFTPIDPTQIPSGELAPVEGTPFDFREMVRIGARIDADDEQLRRGQGYDHNWVLRGGGRSLALAARVWEPTSGRTLEVRTTEPGVQFYSGNVLDGSIRGKGGRSYERRSGFCLETQHFPDSPNQPGFPSTVLRPGEEYVSRTVYRFGVD
jgi:aldose 1-epimerase